MIVLYGTQGSGAAAVEAALEIAGVPYRSVEAASWKPGSPGLEDLRGVNPLAQIPTVVYRVDAVGFILLAPSTLAQSLIDFLVLSAADVGCLIERAGDATS